MHAVSEPQEDDLMAAMHQFIVDQAEGKSDETARRYTHVADDLTRFIANVDVGPWLGDELGRYLQAQRELLGAEALLTSLGLTSLIRVLPAFGKEPWLPPSGAQRRTHRTVMRRLLTFLRLRAHQAGCLNKDDFAVARKAISNHDYGTERPVHRDGTVTCTVTLDLVEHFVDRLLEEVTDGGFETLDDAIAARLNPVKVSVWREPDYDRGYRW